MKVWALFESTGYSTDWMLGVFSSRQSAVDWLRKSRRFMREPGGPIIPDGDRLNDRFWVREETVDPEPISEYDMSPYA